MDFINAAHYDSSSSAAAVINKPTNTADNDIMFAIVKHLIDEAITPPTGWALLGKGVATSNIVWLYWKLAASEGASYTWTWATAARTGGTIVTYRNGFNTTSPIDVVSNTGYTTTDTIVRAASMNAAAANSALIFFGSVHDSAANYYTKPTVPADVWVEDVDQDGSAVGSRFNREICHMTWTGSGATGNMDAVYSASVWDKHAFAVALNPAAAGGLSIDHKVFRGMNRGIARGME